MFARGPSRSVPQEAFARATFFLHFLKYSIPAVIKIPQLVIDPQLSEAVEFVEGRTPIFSTRGQENAVSLTDFEVPEGKEPTIEASHAPGVTQVCGHPA